MITPRGVFLAAAAALLVSADRPADRFDAICTHPNGEPGVHLKVDLLAGQWCNARGGCERGKRIVSATPLLIVLNERRDEASGFTIEAQDLDLIASNYVFFTREPLSIASMQKCSFRAFSGIPNAPGASEKSQNSDDR